MWIWISIIVVSIIWWSIVLMSYIQIKIYFSRNKDDDLLRYDVRALLGLLRYRAEIPMAIFKGQDIEVKAEMIFKNTDHLLADFQENITAGKIIAFYQKITTLTNHVFGFSDWLTATMSNIKCIKLRWSTNLGVGDAAATAITTGVVWGIKSALLRNLFKKITLEAQPQIAVDPQYNRTAFSTEIICVMKIRHFYALLAKLLLIIRIMRVKGGIKIWAKTIYRTYLVWKHRKKERMA